MERGDIQTDEGDGASIQRSHKRPNSLARMMA
jgi:hypothetical protein